MYIKVKKLNHRNTHKKRKYKKRSKKPKTLKGGKTIYIRKRNNGLDYMKISSRNNSFNKDMHIREGHNCYTYFLNKKSRKSYDRCKKEYKTRQYCSRPQPGYYSNMPSMKKDEYNCPIVLKRTLTDNPNIYKSSKTEKCHPEYYKGAIVVAPKRDYHYYRLNDEGQWTHKPGYKPSTHLDSDNNIITDPEKASRNYGGTLNYSDFCGFYCVPRNPNKKFMDMKYGGKQIKSKSKSSKSSKSS